MQTSNSSLHDLHVSINQFDRWSMTFSHPATLVKYQIRFKSQTATVAPRPRILVQLGAQEVIIAESPDRAHLETLAKTMIMRKVKQSHAAA